jgi:hypothetical protein
MIIKMDEQGKWKNVSNEEWRKNYRTNWKEPLMGLRMNILRAYVLTLWIFKEQNVKI